MQQQKKSETQTISVTRLMVISVAARIVVDTSVQMFSPFLPIIAEGLNTNVVAMGRLVALRSATGFFSPLFGAYADMHSYRRVLQIGLLSGAIGMTVIGLSTSIWMAAIGMIFAGICFAAFVPTLQAYVSTRLPYSRRARGLGILEYSWALTGIIGLYLLGQLIEVTNWRMPFFILAAGMLVAAVVFGMLPSARSSHENDEPEDSPALTLNSVQRLTGFFNLGANARSTYGAIGMNCFIMFAAVQFMIVYGAWFYDDFGLSAGRLGTVALVFGLFDLTASVSVSLFTDHIGKWRSVLIGLLGSLAGYIVIPFFGFGVLTAILAVAITRGFFEFSIVANMPLLSEQVPKQRGKVMTLSSAFTMTTVTLAYFTGPWLYANYGIPAVSTLSAFSAIVALLLLMIFVREPAVQESD